MYALLIIYKRDFVFLVSVQFIRKTSRLLLFCDKLVHLGVFIPLAADCLIEPPCLQILRKVSAEIPFHYIDAVTNIEQLKRFPSFKATRRRLAGMYASVLADVDEITLPETADDRDHAWHLYIIRLKLDKLKKTRDEIAAALRRENIGTSVNFYGLHLHHYYREALGMKPEDFPNATAASYEVLSLPLHPQMTDKNAHEVVEALKKVIAHARK